MGTTYTYLVADLRTGTIIDELPLTGVTFEKQLNDTGSSAASCTSTTRHQGPGTTAADQPGRTAMYVNRDGELLWGGIVGPAGTRRRPPRWRSGRPTSCRTSKSLRPEPGPDQHDLVHRRGPDRDSPPDPGDRPVPRRRQHGPDVHRHAVLTDHPDRALRPQRAQARRRPVAGLANATTGLDFTFDVRYDTSGEPERVVQVRPPTDRPARRAARLGARREPDRFHLAARRRLEWSPG